MEVYLNFFHRWKICRKVKMLVVVLVMCILSCKPSDEKFSSVDNSSFDEGGTRSSFSLGIKIDGTREDSVVGEESVKQVGRVDKIGDNGGIEEPNTESVEVKEQRVYVKEVVKDGTNSYPLAKVELVPDKKRQQGDLSQEQSSYLNDLHLNKDDTIEAIDAYATDINGKKNEGYQVYEFWVKNIQSWGVAMDYILANESISGISLKIDRKGVKLKTPVIEVPKLKKEDISLGNYEGRCLVYGIDHGKKYPISCSLVEVDLYCKLSRSAQNKKVSFESRRACVINKHKTI